jgi:hypothetical protein
MEKLSVGLTVMTVTSSTGAFPILFFANPAIVM